MQVSALVEDGNDGSLGSSSNHLWSLCRNCNGVYVLNDDFLECICCKLICVSNVTMMSVFYSTLLHMG